MLQACLRQCSSFVFCIMSAICLENRTEDDFDDLRGCDIIHSYGHDLVWKSCIHYGCNRIPITSHFQLFRRLNICLNWTLSQRINTARIL